VTLEVDRMSPTLSSELKFKKSFSLLLEVLRRLMLLLLSSRMGWMLAWVGVLGCWMRGLSRKGLGGGFLAVVSCGCGGGGGGGGRFELDVRLLLLSPPCTPRPCIV